MKMQENLCCSFFKLNSDILHKKYRSSIDLKNNRIMLGTISNIIHKQMSHEVIEYEDIILLNQRKQFLKRGYGIGEFDTKIEAITEFYRFKVNFPSQIDSSIQKIMERYQNDKQKVQRKQIKNFMKENHGVSISSIKTFSSSESSVSHFQKKSRYSTKLSMLNSNRSTVIWENLCNNIDVALKNVRPLYFFKRNNLSNQNSFKKFLMREKLMRKSSKEKNKKNKKIEDDADKYKLQPRSHFQRKYKAKSAGNLRKMKLKSFSKTTANETASREQTCKGFRKRIVGKKSIKSLSKILPETMKIQRKSAEFKKIHSLHFCKKQPIRIEELTQQKQHRVLTKKRITSAHCLKKPKQNVDKTNHAARLSCTKLPKINKNDTKVQPQFSKNSRKLLIRQPSKNAIKAASCFSPYKKKNSFHPMDCPNKAKGVNELIRRKLNIRG